MWISHSCSCVDEQSPNESFEILLNFRRLFVVENPLDSTAENKFFFSFQANSTD